MSAEDLPVEILVDPYSAVVVCITQVRAFQFNGPDAEILVSTHSKCITEVRAYNRSTTEQTHLTSAGQSPIEAGKQHYIVLLPESTLSAGNYRLEYIVRVKGENPMDGYLICAVPARCLDIVA